MRTRILFPLLALALILAGPVDRAPVAHEGTVQAAQPSAQHRIDLSHYQDLRWRNVGPTRGGRSTAYAGVRTQPCTFYFGGTGGGVFKTENCGADWVPITDGQIDTGSIGAIEVSDSNPDIIYLGTGSAAIRSNVIIGRGLYKSTDAGRTWQFMGLKDAGQIGSIAVHPTNPDVAWAAAMGSPFGPNAERGIYKTTDGGRTWRKTLFVNDETGGRVVAMNWSNPNELYAGMYRGFRKGWDIVSGGPASEGGIYKSTDGGETWTKLSKGLPQDLIGKIDIDIARSNPRVVYAMVEAPGEQGGLYKSTDSGASWTLVNNSTGMRQRPFYFHYVDVNPKDENDLWIGAVSQYRSTDGGRTLFTVPTPHADNHGIWFNPDNPDYAVQVNDGGANVTRDGGRTWSSILNQPTAEIYMVSVDDRYPYNLYGPQQDNSTLIVPSQNPFSYGLDTPAQAWTQASGCETGSVWPTPDGKIVWGACKGEVERLNVETGQSQGKWIYPQNRYGHHPADIQYRFARQTPILVSPHDPKVVYQASHVLHRSTDDGVTWEVISPDLTAFEPEYQIVPGNPITRDVTGEEVYSNIYAIDESPVQRGVLWTGANDGPVHVSRDNGKTWKNVTPKDLPPGGRVQNIGTSPHRAGSAYIAVYRFLREHDLKPYIYRTDDYGETWTKLTDGRNGIPDDHPTRVVREDPEQEGLLYAGTEFGFFVSFDNGRAWQPLQQNLPATPVTDLRVQRGDLVIATMGRSFWIMDNVAPLRALAAHVEAPQRTTELPPYDGPRVGTTGSIGVTVTRGGTPPPGMAGGARPSGTAVSTRVGVGGVIGGGAEGREAAAAAQAVLDLSQPVLLPPATRIRYRSGGGGRAAVPQYPPVALAIDYILPAGFNGPLTLEITDAKGRVVRTVEAAAAPPAGGRGEIDMQIGGGGRGRGRGAAAPLTAQPGHNRHLWDYRWENNGPLAAPGSYIVSLTAGAPGGDGPRLSPPILTQRFEVAVDPRVLADGITVADLVEQQEFLLKAREVQARAIALRARVQEAMQKAGVEPPSPPGPGESPFRRAAGTPELHPLQALYARLVTPPGTYQQGMIVDQLNNIVRAEGGADQKVGAEARRRLADLEQAIAAIDAELRR
jgi:photosystem II stability/assembly factor-like uncharacterized protein